MKLTKIKIVNFGQFSNFTFNLPDANLAVFFGPNEAGKSTIVAFIKQILFGFHLAKHNSIFFENYQPLARVSPMGGSLFFQDERDNSYELERLYATGKGSKVGTLTVKQNGQVVPEALFFDQIKNIDGEFYSDSFIFNQDTLAKVAKIQQSDLLERIYYLGAANSDKLIDLRDDYAKKASALFKKGGSNPPINQLLKMLKEQRRKVDEAENEFADYRALKGQLKKQQAQLKKQEQHLLELQNNQQHIEQLQKLVPSYQKLLNLKAQIEEVVFDQKQFQTAQALEIEKRNLQKQTQQLQKRLEQYSEQKNSVHDNYGLIHKKAEVLQWRSEYRNCLENQKQIASEKEQLLTLNPALTKVAMLDQTEIVELQDEFHKLPLNEAPAKQLKQINVKYWLVGSGILAILGLILLAMKQPIFAGLTILVGIFGGFSSFSRQEKVKKAQADLNAKTNLAKKQRAAFTEKYGLSPDQINLPNLINAWRQYQLQEQKQKALQGQVKELLKQTEQLAKKVGHALQHEIAPDFDSVITALDQLAEQEARTQQNWKDKVNLENTIADNMRAVKELDLRLKAVFAEAKVADMSAYEALQTKKMQQDKLQAEISGLSANLKQDMPALKEFQQNNYGKQESQKLIQQLTDQQNVIHSLQADGAELKVKMTDLANSTAVFSAKQDLANLKTKFQNLSTEYLADVAASKWIGRALDLASNERFPKMLKMAKEYLRLLTNNRYNSIEIDKKLTVTRFDGKKIKVQYLSRGTSEQLYFALKLAFIQQIKDQINLPILIDDSFVNFDDRRVDQIKQLLEQVAHNNQVLIFTAQANLVEKLQVQPLTFRKDTDNV